MTNIGQSVRRDSLKNQIVRHLLAQIASGRLQPGICLPPERELAQQFSVSRAAIREAVSILAAQGFVNVRHGSGMYVNPISCWNTLHPVFVLLQGEELALNELMEVRESLEPTVAFLAAQRATSADITALERSLESDWGQSVDKHVELDVAFHQALVQAANNRVFLVLSNSITELLNASRQRAFSSAGSARARHWHREILDAIKARDPVRAREAMCSHLEQVRGELQDIIGHAATDP